MAHLAYWRMHSVPSWYYDRNPSFEAPPQLQVARHGLLYGKGERRPAHGDQPTAAATGALVSSNSAGSNRASRRLYSFANAGQMVKFRPSAPTYHE
jgi:hypothetical protein